MKKISIVRFLCISLPAFLGAVIVCVNIHSKLFVYEAGTQKFIELVEKKSDLHESGEQVLDLSQVSQMLKKIASRDIEKDFIGYLSRLLYFFIALSLFLSFWLGWVLAIEKDIS